MGLIDLLNYINNKEEKDDDIHELDSWQQETIKKGYYNPWNFEEEELEEDDYYKEDDD